MTKRVIVNIMLKSGKSKGGLQQVFVDYINAQKMLGYESHVICMFNYAYIDQIKKLSCVVHTLRSCSVFNLVSILKVRKIINRLKPNYILLHGNRAISMVYHKMLPDIKYKTISVVHDSIHRFKKPNYIIAVSKAIQQEIIKYIPKDKKNKVFLLSNATRYHSYKEKIFNDPPVIGTISRFYANKDHFTFLKALKILKDSNIRFKAKLAGGGPLANELQLMAIDLDLTKEVSFVGWCDNKEIFFLSIDLFCSSSIVEPFGLTLLEAMAYSTPIVTTNTRGAMDIFKDDSNSFAMVVPIKDEKKLAQALKEMISDREKSLLLAKNANNLVKEKYSMENLSKNFEVILNTIEKFYKK